jgi:arginase
MHIPACALSGIWDHAQRMQMNIDIIQVPYDSGHRDTRTGRGPAHFIRGGLVNLLEGGGHAVTLSTVTSGAPLPTEIGLAIDVNRRLAGAVRTVVGRNHFPLVLAGNCNTCVGMIGGVAARRPGIIWFDAHGDFNTPETTTTGFLDGMGLAMVAGRCWGSLLNTITGFQPVDASHIIHVGARDLDPAEVLMLRDAGIPVLAPDPADRRKFLAELTGVLPRLKNRVEGVYLHIDMDVLQTEYGQPNHLAVPGGLPPDVAVDAIGIIKKQLPLLGCTVASFDPAYDENDCVLNAGLAVICAVVDNQHRF